MNERDLQVIKEAYKEWKGPEMNEKDPQWMKGAGNGIKVFQQNYLYSLQFVLGVFELKQYNYFF